MAFILGTIFQNLVDSAALIDNTTAKQDFNVTRTIGANSMPLGKRMRVRLAGRFSVPAALPPTITLGLDIVGDTRVVLVTAGQAAVSIGVTTNGGWI